MKKFKIKVSKLSDKKAYILASLLFLAVAAIVLTWFLEYRYFINSFSRTWSFAIGSPAPFFFNALLMWLILVFMWGIFEKPGTAAGFMWIVITLITYAHINKFNSRGFPLSPEPGPVSSLWSRTVSSKGSARGSEVHAARGKAIAVKAMASPEVKCPSAVNMIYSPSSMAACHWQRRQHGRFVSLLRKVRYFHHVSSTDFPVCPIIIPSSDVSGALSCGPGFRVALS